MSAAKTTPLDAARYVNLETFKKSGAGVKTPVWAAPLDGKLVIFSEGTAFKVKRLRNDARIRIAACDMRGGVAPDATWYEGTGRIIEDAGEIQRALAALGAKYGWQMKVTNFGARVTGRFAKRAYLEITLAS